VNYLRGVFSLGSVRSGRSRTFGLWSKYFAGISDSRGSSISKSESNYENKNKSSKAIRVIVFRYYFVVSLPIILLGPF
jgi:hypothetical protein